MSAAAARHPRTLLLATVVVGAATATLVATATGGAAPPSAGLNLLRHQPVAFVHTHAEGGYEGLQSPSQEQYDNRAYPRQYIDPTQSRKARTSFQKLSADPGGGNSGKIGGGTVGSGSGSGSSTGSAGWSEVGPTNPVDNSPLLEYGGNLRVISGRALTILVDSPCTVAQCRVWVGTAGGGIWRTDNGLGGTGTQNWQAVNTGLTSNAVVSLVKVGSTLYAGTGEPDGSNDSEAGTGLFKSTDGGDSWSLVGTSASVAADRSLGAIWVDPANSQHLFIGTAAARHGASAVWGGRAFPPGAPHLGVFESTDGGATWSPSLQPDGDNAFLGGVTNLTADPNPGDLYAGVVGYGLYRRSHVDGSWTRVFTSASLNQPGAGIGGGRVEVGLSSNGNGTTTAYLGDSDTLGGSWVYKTSNVAAVTTKTWTQLSSKNPGDAGFAVYGYCETQCGYDDFIVTSPTNPNVVYVGGSAQYDELGPAYSGKVSPSNGRAVMRSTDGGATWTDMTQDNTKIDGSYTALHPDQHSLTLIPGTGGFFEVSDGGLVRVDSATANRAGECATRGLSATQLAECNVWLSAVPNRIVPLNQGLADVQFQSVSTDSAGDLLGGTQDNGTFSFTHGDPSSWFETIFGDGGQSGFDAGNSNIRYHNYYDATPDVNFHGSQVSGWDWIGDPLQKENQSFYIPFIADPSRAGYAFAGLEHVWRTTDNGGGQAYLDAHCNEFDYRPLSNRPCGDWEALGGGGSGGTQGTGSAGDAGDLTGTYFGQSRKGEFVTQVSRANDAGTVWAATRTGRVFISKNLAAQSQNVRWTRIDTASTPGRFVSGIVVDPNDANHAWVSYSGYSAYAAGGHVYEVRFNPASNSATWTDLSYDLGDVPITSLVRTTTGDLYAGTDFGVAHLSPGAGSWNKDTDLPTVSVFSLVLSPDGHTVFAGTHGRGAWRLAV